MALASPQTMADARNAPAAQVVPAYSTTLTRVALRNFKGHADLKLDLGKITVLIGPTSSGKSTVLQALNLLRSALQTGSIRMQGWGQEYGRFEDLVTNRDKTLDIGIGVDGRRRIRTSRGMGIAADFSYGMSFGRSLRPARVRAVVDARLDPPPPHADGMRIDHEYGAGTECATTVSGPWTGNGSPVSVRADGGFAPAIDADLAKSPMARTFGEVFGGGRFFRSMLDGLRHVPFSRVVTSYALPLGRDEGTLSPDRARVAASLLGRISGDHLLQEKTSRMMREMGLGTIMTRNILTGRGEDPMLALDFARGNTFCPITHGGSGPNQLVSMLATLADSPEGAIVTIEEPELHLDPAAQAHLVGILVRQATEENKQIVFTTHSDRLLYYLLDYVARAGCPLAGGDVAMHYFNTDESGNMAGAERLPVNERGQVPGGLKGFWYADGRAMAEILG